MSREIDYVSLAGLCVRHINTKHLISSLIHIIVMLAREVNQRIVLDLNIHLRLLCEGCKKVCTWKVLCLQRGRCRLCDALFCLHPEATLRRTARKPHHIKGCPEFQSKRLRKAFAAVGVCECLRQFVADDREKTKKESQERINKA